MKTTKSRRRLLLPILLAAFLSLDAIIVAATLTRVAASPVPPTSAHFAVIGDFGSDGQPELDVSNLVHSWNPDFIVTVGDNNYPDGDASTIDPNIGQYYHDFIYPYLGSYGQGATFNKFFPALGNHDWVAPNAQPYLDYFTLPGNERYYDYTWGPVHFYAVDSDPSEPDGITSNSIQGQWLQNRLASGTEPWKIVYFHHPPYSSGSNHGSTPALQWPFAQWGASAVLAGHEHNYERLDVNGIPYIVDGLGGRSIYDFGSPLPQSIVRYNADYGAMLMDATTVTMTFQFKNSTGTLIDSYTVDSNAPTRTITPTPTNTGTPTRTYTPTRTPTRTITPTPCIGYSQMFMGSIATGDPTQAGRVTRNNIVSTCQTSKPFPGYSNNSPWHYDAYTFMNNNPVTSCMTVMVTNSCSNNILSTAYLNSFDPATITTNYIADPGNNTSNMEYAFNVPAGGIFVVVVHEVASGGCANYMLTVSGFACGSTATPTRTATPIRTSTPTSTITPTYTPMPPPALVGHVNWQGPPAQPSSRQQLPITLTLRSASTEVNYPGQVTDSSGFFTVSVSGLPSGTYDWRVKGPKYLASSGSLALSGAPQTGADMNDPECGCQVAGDSDNNNVVNALDFTVLKGTFAKALGDPGYDARADFNNDNVINTTDFTIQKNNFGKGGAPPIAPR